MNKPLRLKMNLADGGLFLEIYYNGNLILYEKMPVTDEDGQVVDFEIYNTIVIPQALLDEFLEKLDQIKKECDRV